jgi:general secretion pathway protein H
MMSCHKPQVVPVHKERVRATAGFTLIEILIVVLIISIVTSVGMLTISRNNNKEMEFFAKELTQVIQLAEEQAMLQSTDLGLIINDQHYQFVVLTESQDKTKAKRWSPLDDNVLGEHSVPNNVDVSVDTKSPKEDQNEEKKEEQKKPQIVISTNGDVTPFSIYIGKKGAKPRFVITGDADGNITRKELE